MRTAVQRPSLGVLLLCLSAATASWDILAVQVIGRSVKLPLVLAIAAIGVWFFQAVVSRGAAPRLGGGGAGVVMIAASLALWLITRAAFEPLRESLPAVTALVLPAIVFPFAVLVHRRWARTISNAFVWGMVFTSIIAAYEWVAQLEHLPRLTSYAGTIGAIPRSAGLAYEPAYFASAALAAGALCYFTWPRGRQRTGALIVLLAGLGAADARATVLEAAVILVVYRVLAIRDRRALSTHRRVVRLVATAIGGLVVVMLVSPGTTSGITNRIRSFTDRNEVESNAVRLRLYDHVSQVVAESEPFGVGPGMLPTQFRRHGYDDEIIQNNVVANNILLQALADGGILAALLEAALAAAVLRCAFRARLQALGAAWAGVVLGAGITVSNFWAITPWLIVGLILSLDAMRTPVPASSNKMNLYIVSGK